MRVTHRQAREGHAPDAEPNTGATGATTDGHEAMLALVDELATLAANLWFEGMLDDLSVHKG
jgi:hypothetical protein